MAKPELQRKAQKLRAQGLSVREITRRLDVSKSSVSRWVRTVRLTKEQQEELTRKSGACHLNGSAVNKEKAQRNREQWQKEGREKVVSGSTLYCIGCMLYWAEGAKNRNTIRFGNSDPDMMVIFVRFLRDELGIDNSEMTIRLQCHVDSFEEVSNIEQFWLNTLSLPKTCLRKASVNRRPISAKHNGKHRRAPYGVCKIEVGRTDLIQQIFGAIQEYAGIAGKKWLW
jgi:predicted transcriptional regulator